MTEPAAEPEPVDPGHDPGVDPPPDEETADDSPGQNSAQDDLDRVDMIDEREAKETPDQDWIASDVG